MAFDWFLERVAAYGGRPAFIWLDQTYSYEWLTAAVKEWHERLDQAGVQPGQVVAIHGDYSPSLCALILALIQNRNIAVPIASASAGNAELFTALSEVEVAFRFAPDDSWQVERTGQTVGHELLLQLQQSGDPGLVLFSSGSTGKPKGIVHNLALLLAKFRQPRAAFRTIAFLLLDHIGGINTLLHTLANGGALITPTGRLPSQVCEAIASHKAELLPTSPTFLNLLLVSESYRQYDLSSLKLVTYGTEVMPEPVLQRLAQALPGVRLQQTYGLSEVGILRAKSKSPDSLWVRVGGEGVETKIVDGVLWVRTQSAMLGYLNAPSPFDAEGWFNTGDRVEVNGEFIRILGRESDWINVGGAKVYPAEVESVLLELDGLVDATVYGEKHPLMGQIVAVRVVLAQPEELSALRQRIRAHCQGRLEGYKIPIKVTVVDSAEYTSRFKKKRT